MAAQINFKIDTCLKEELEKVLEELGFSVSAVTRAFYKQLVRNKRIDFYLENDINTSSNLTGEKLEEEMIKEGYDKAYAKEHKKAYNDMINAKKSGKLIDF